MRPARCLPPLLAALVGLACAPQPPADTIPGARPNMSEIRLEGVPRVVGSVPVDVQVVLQRDDGRSTRLTGPLAAEIGRLAGARVAVWGRPGEGRLDVARYEVLAVDGAPVVTGVVERGPGGEFRLRTEAGQLIGLTGAASRLREGQKVWIRGPMTVEVQSYGVIRP